MSPEARQEVVLGRAEKPKPLGMNLQDAATEELPLRLSK